MIKSKFKGIRKVIIIICWLIVWQILALLIHNSIFMVGPKDALMAWIANLQKPDFLKVVFVTFGKITLGSAMAFVLGSFLAILSYRWKLVGEILEPVFSLLKAIPVASFVVLLLIWWGSRYISVAICFLIVLPNVYVNVLQGFAQADVKLLEMAEVFHMPLWNKVFYIYRPALQPFVESCLKISLSMSWKSGIAAEVIGTPSDSIGEKLYMSKIYLNTADLFAWTATIILLSVAFEKIGIRLWRSFCNIKPSCKQPQKKAVSISENVLVKNLYKSYEGKNILHGTTKELEAGNIYCLMAPSGEGKTTLLKVLAGLESEDNKEAKNTFENCSFSFQEDRLLEEETPLRNLEVVCGSVNREALRQQLLCLLPKECLMQPCAELSGGMKRRVSIVRAMVANSSIVLLDEPFNGLDKENKEQAMRYLMKEQRGRLLVLATHEESDAKFVDAKVWRLARKA